MRTALTALGIIIGVAAVIVMVAIGAGASAAIQREIRSAGSNIVMVSAGSGGFGPVRQGQGAVTTPDGRRRGGDSQRGAGRSLPVARDQHPRAGRVRVVQLEHAGTGRRS